METATKEVDSKRPFEFRRAGTALGPARLAQECKGDALGLTGHPADPGPCAAASRPRSVLVIVNDKHNGLAFLHLPVGFPGLPTPPLPCLRPCRVSPESAAHFRSGAGGPQCRLRGGAGPARRRRPGGRV